MRALLVFIIGLIGFSVTGATNYIRSGASGANSGENWTDAWTALPATLTRGDTYYIADGEYAAYTFNDAANGSLITVKKATASDHGTDTGWQDSYGDSVAAWPQWVVTTSDWVFDGQTGGGPGSWETGCGIVVSNAPSDAGRINNGGTAGLTNIAFRHIEISCGVASGPPYDDAVYWPAATTNITFSHCWIHDIPGDVFQIRGWADFTFEYCKVARNWQDATRHGDVFEHDNAGANFVFRYNFFEDCTGTYIIGHHTTGNLDGCDVYGNVFYWTTGTAAETDNGIIATLNPGAGGTINNLRVFNNSFANIQGDLSAGINIANGGTGNVVTNNIFLRATGATASVGFSGVEHDYNGFYNCGDQTEGHLITLSGNPWVNMAARDFTLAAAQAGASLSNTYNTDPLGSTRGADGVWDIGAYEFGGEVVSPPGDPPSSSGVLRAGTVRIGRILMP